MIYLDYNATTPVDESVLETFIEVSKTYIGNPNSLHKIGNDSNNLIEEATKSIKRVLSLNDEEIIYTSSATESNNLAIKGIALKYQNRGKHIIATMLEHSSVIGTVGYLQSLGFEVDFVEVDEYGLVDTDNLKNLLRDDTILVSLCHVSSEVGICQNIEKISTIVKNYPKCFFHIDATQSIGKIKFDCSCVDLITFSAHKFYGLKGIAGLIKKKNIVITPSIHGGKSTTIYRSGTPSVALITSMAKALRLVYENIDENYKYVEKLNKMVIDEFSTMKNIFINSNEKCLAYTINFSTDIVKPETFMHSLEMFDIYISTKSACASNSSLSKEVFALTNDDSKAKNSLRVSLSYKTTVEEIEYFLEKFKTCYEKFGGGYNETN